MNRQQEQLHSQPVPSVVDLEVEPPLEDADLPGILFPLETASSNIIFIWLILKTTWKLRLTRIMDARWLVVVCLTSYSML